MHPQTPVAGVGQRFGECPSKFRTEGVIWLLLQRCGHSVRPASHMLAEPQLLSRCFQCRVARGTEQTAKDSESGTLKIHVALAPCIPRHRLPVLVSALASAQASSAQKV